MANLLVAEKELKTIARAKPVVRPSLRALSGAADPTPQNIAVVDVSVQITIRSIVKPAAIVEGVIGVSQRIVCVAALSAKIQFRKLRKPGNINPGTPHGAFRISKRQGPGLRVDEEDDLVVREAVAIKGQPLAQLGNPVGKIETRETARLGTASRKIAAPVQQAIREGAQRCPNTRAG